MWVFFFFVHSCDPLRAAVSVYIKPGRVITAYVYGDILINLEPIKLFSHVVIRKKKTDTKCFLGKISDQ